MEKISDTKVKILNHGIPGAPQLTNNWGDLNKVLKAVLVDGLNEKTITQLSYDSSKKELTLEGEISGYAKDSVIKITGHSNPKVNQEFRVVARNSSTSITVLAKEDLGVVGSEAVTIKLAPLGYTLAYDDIATTGTACYKNTDPEFPAILKVIDKVPPNNYTTGWAKFGRVVVGDRIDSEGNFVEEIKTPKNPQYPNAEKTGNNVAGASGIHGYAKWYHALHGDSGNTESTVVSRSSFYPAPWWIIGDSNTFYLFINLTGTRVHDSWTLYAFGLYNDVGLKRSIFLNAVSGFRTANTSVHTFSSGFTSYSTFGNSFADLNAHMNNTTCQGLFLFQALTGEYSTTLNIQATGLTLNLPPVNFPQKSSFNMTNPLNGSLLLSDFHILSCVSEFAYRGTLRGFKIPYGITTFTRFTRFNSYISVYASSQTQRSGDYEGESVPFLISLKDWD